MSLGFEPKTRLAKILCGLQGVVAKTQIEKAVKYAVDNAGKTPLEVTGVLSTDGNSKTVLTFDRTAAELYENFAAGRLCKISFAASENHNAECVCPVAAIKNESDGEISYMFRCDTDTTYVCTNVDADDVVVMTEI